MQVQYFKWICCPNACYRFILLDPVPFRTCLPTFQTVVAANLDPFSYFLCCLQRLAYQLSCTLRAAKSRHLFDLNLAHDVFETQRLYRETEVMFSLTLLSRYQNLSLYSIQNFLGESRGHAKLYAAASGLEFCERADA